LLGKGVVVVDRRQLAASDHTVHDDRLRVCPAQAVNDLPSEPVALGRLSARAAAHM